MAPAIGTRIVVHQKPARIAVLVTPWNYPAAKVARKIGPALAAGYPVVIKPASEMPLTMLAIMPILEEAGAPRGVVDVFPSRSSGAVVDEMLADSRVRVVSFTGSTEVGRKLLRSAAENVVKPAMELGGNAPFIVCNDADLDAAADGLMVAKIRNIGEACTAANRIYVHEEIEGAFVERYTARMAALTIGNGLESGIDVGPLADAESWDKVDHLVRDAVAKGTDLKLGGVRPNGPGFYYPPTVMINVADAAECLRGEVFGRLPQIRRSGTGTRSSGGQTTPSMASSRTSTQRTASRHGTGRAA